MTQAQVAQRDRSRTLFAKMWQLLTIILATTFLGHAILVVATLQLGADAQTERRLQRIGEYWSGQPKLEQPVGIDPITVVYPKYELLPPNIQRMLKPHERGIFELGPRSQDYFVLSQARDDGPAFYVVEFHSEVKPNDTIESQILFWYLMGMVPLSALLIWLCKRITERISSPLQEIGKMVNARDPRSLEMLHLPEGSPIELEALVDQINRALQRTAEVLDRERSFTQFASHELRTPAAVVQAALERVESNARPEQAAAIERARRGLRDMHVLIDTFLQLSGDTVRIPKSPVTVDEQWVSSLYLHLFGEAPRHELLIDERQALELWAPETMVHVLIANMLKNAVFHGAAAPIRVRICDDAITVENDLPEKSSAPGFGVGTQIARRVCDRFGWRFDLRIGDRGALAEVKLKPSAPAADGSPAAVA